MNKTFAQLQTEDRRLAILRGMQVAAGGSINSILLRRYLDSVGHKTSADRLEADLAWLGEQGLVTLAAPDLITVATLTLRGADVAEGRAHVPGVQVPQPGV